MLGNANAYMAKPAYTGETTGAFYLSGRRNQGYEYYAEEINRSTELSGHVSFISKHMYASVGLFSFGGKYKVNPLNAYNTTGGWQSFNGFGGRGELGLRLPLKSKADLLVGINGESFSEWGKYSENSSNFFTNFFSLGLSTVYMNAAPSLDFRITPSDRFRFGLRYTYDIFYTLNDILGDRSNSNLHRLTLHGSAGEFVAYGQLGFTPDGQRLSSVGLSYGISFQKKKPSQPADADLK